MIRKAQIGTCDVINVHISFVVSVSLMLNGHAVVSVGGGNDTSASNSILLPVKRGDRVWLQLNRGKLVEILPDKGYN